MDGWEWEDGATSQQDVGGVICHGHRRSSSHKAAGVSGHGGLPEPLLNEFEGVVEVGMTGQLRLMSILVDLRSRGIMNKLVRGNVTWVGLKL